MAVVIELIVALLEPLVLQWLKNLLTKHAAGMAPTGDDAADAQVLLACALADPALDLHPFKRAVVALLESDAPPAIRAKAKLSESARTVIAELAARIPDDPPAP